MARGWYQRLVGIERRDQARPPLAFRGWFHSRSDTAAQTSLSCHFQHHIQGRPAQDIDRISSEEKNDISRHDHLSVIKPKALLDGLTDELDVFATGCFSSSSSILLSFHFTTSFHDFGIGFCPSFPQGNVSVSSIDTDDKSRQSLAPFCRIWLRLATSQLASSKCHLCSR
jgi:hypothetical protein